MGKLTNYVIVRAYSVGSVLVGQGDAVCIRRLMVLMDIGICLRRATSVHCVMVLIQGAPDPMIPRMFTLERLTAVGPFVASFDATAVTASVKAKLFNSRELLLGDRLVVASFDHCLALVETKLFDSGQLSV